jgi:hypothetical protein
MENPRDPHNEEVFQRETVVERETRSEPPVDRRTPGTTWIWIVGLLIVVAVLIWFVLTRGEPSPVQVPEMRTPAVEPARQEIDVEIRTPSAPEPAARPQQPAAPPDQPPPDGT